MQGFFLTNDISQAIADNFDHYSTTYADKLPFLSGAGIRGVLRSRAEHNARTITNMRVNKQDDFFARCAASDPLVMSWSQHEEGIESTTSRIMRGTNDVWKLNPPYDLFDLSERLFGTTYYGSRLMVSDAALKAGTTAKWKKLDFVAIDRFTGGAANKMKFDAYALWQPTFSCELHLESPTHWELGCLLQILLDVQEGLVAFGYGAAKGFGDAILQNLNVTFGYSHPLALDIPPINAITENTFFNTKSVTDWNELLSFGLIEAWIEAVANYRTPNELPHDTFSDPYWGKSEKRDYALDVLYPRQGEHHDN
jgi:hypothetical protein